MTRILFVCLGNICRSPAAEGVMTSLVERAGLSNTIACDSAGTAAYHVGEAADARMRRAAAERGYDLTSTARQFDPHGDFETFDLIVAMDNDNYRDIVAQDPEGRYRDKVVRMADFKRVATVREVPDPYYGGIKGFDRVLDILEDTCKGLLDHIRNR